MSVELYPALADAVFPPFDAEAHIDLYRRDGLVRSYSLCNIDTGSRSYIVAVLNDRASRGGARYIHEGC